MNLQTTTGKKIDLDFAEKVVRENEIRGKLFDGLTTSKLRGLLDYVNNIYSVIINSTEDKLSEKNMDDLRYLKVKFAYEVGKDKYAVKRFVQETYVKDLIDNVLEVGTRRQFLDYCKYFEALVAYSKFYGMENK